MANTFIKQKRSPRPNKVVMKTLLSSRDRSDAIAMGYDGPVEPGDQDYFELGYQSGVPEYVELCHGTDDVVILSGVSQIRCVRDALNKVLQELEKQP